MKKWNSIEVESASKRFDIKYTTFYGGTAKSGTKHVLNGLSFEVKKGEVFGVIGRNGSGKSTLLKILSGILYPDNGTVNICGKVASILELGMGFETDLTGRENIHIKCSMYGFSPKEIDNFIDDIVQFSELGEQIDHPLRTYSSGMTAKLAFSILIHVRCDVLVVDEVLSVGDASFNAKCKMVFERMKKGGKTIVIASHNLSTLEEMCDRVLWIESGRAKEIGDSVTTCYHYNSDLTDSYETICALAEGGDIVSQNRAGVMCRDGLGTTMDIPQAMEWFSRASDMGYSEAQLNLADMKLKLGDENGAMALYKKASESGNITATVRMMSMKSDSRAIGEKLIARIREESLKGNLRAKKLLADVLFNGTISAKNQIEAHRLYTECAERGDVPSQYIVGTCYRDGVGVQKNGDESIKWLTLASKNGNARARVDLAAIYRNGINIERDMKKSIEWYKTAAACGDANAMLQLGTIYRDGLGVDRDAGQSEYWLSRYAVQGLLSAEVTLGDILKQSNNDSIRRESLEWYENAAKEGFPQGAYNMAICNRDGVSTPADSEEALKWFSVASEMQHIYGLFECANMYLRGNGTKRDLAKAFEFMQHSADMGNQNAMLQLAVMYKDGLGVERDVVKAKHILSILTEYGNLIAINILSML